jgi:hypothetical protein
MIDHIAVDGRREVRSNAICHTDGTNGMPYNLYIEAGDNLTLRYSASVNTLCWSSLVWAPGTFAHNSVVVLNYIAHNGADYASPSPSWSDGMTVGFIDGSRVDYNTFEDNTDVDLILGGGTNSTVKGNQITHTQRHSFAALMLTNWSNPNNVPGGMWSDFRGLDVSLNGISCGDLCAIAMQLGVLTWHDASYAATFATMGGSVHDNAIYSNKQAINVAGGGTQSYPISIGANTIAGGCGSVCNNTYFPTADNMARYIQTSYLNVTRPGTMSFVTLAPGVTVDTTNDTFGLF